MQNRDSVEMNAPMRLFVSAVGIASMFGLGRVVARALRRRSEEAAEFVEPMSTQVPVTESIVIRGEPEEVYEQARQLEYFDQFLFGVGGFRLINPTSAQLLVTYNGHEYAFRLQVIADEPGEFFGFRVEHHGELYGTCLVRFEPLVAGEMGTMVSASTKFKHQFAPDTMSVIARVVSREIDAYLRNLKDSFERSAAESVVW